VAAEAVLVTCRSAAVLPAGVTVVVTVPVLLVRLVSPAVVVPVAALVTAPEVLGVTTMVIVAGVPLLTVPRLAVTTPPAWVTAPWLDVADTKVTPAGSASRTVVPVAGLALRSVTVTV